MRAINFLIPAEGIEEQRELGLEIFNNLRQQIPVLYVALLINLFGMNITTGFDIIAVSYSLAFFFLLLTVRGIYWIYVQSPSRDSRSAANELLLVAGFTAIFSVSFVVIALILVNRHPGLMLAIIFFNILGALAAAYALSAFPRVAIIPIVIMGLPVASCLLASEGSLHQVMGLSLGLMLGLFMSLLRAHGKALSSVIYSRIAVANERNRAINAEVAAIKRADHDALTGLANRARLLREMQHDIKFAKASAPGSLLAICDLDSFKPANDAFGHAAGDAILIAFGQRLLAAFGDNALVSRMGGDEFAVFWRDGLPKHEIATVGPRICGLANQPICWEGKKLKVGASCGLVEAGPYTRSISELLRQADSALYRAKALGAGKHQTYDENALADDNRNSGLEALLRKEETLKEFSFQYQPVFSLTNGSIAYIEALARWENQEFGNVSPSEFFNIAEKSGIFEKLNQYLMKEAISHAKKWPRHVLLSFNLGGVQLGRTGAADRIVQSLVSCGFPTNRMIFEVRIANALADFDTVKEEIEVLRRAGCLVAIDDFGIGKVSVAQLGVLNFDIVKLDGTLTRNITHSPRSRQILLGLINLWHATDAVCVAEQIEEPGQLDMLKAMGCDYAQGYLLWRPVCSEEVGRFFLDQPTSLRDQIVSKATQSLSPPGKRTAE